MDNIEKDLLKLLIEKMGNPNQVNAIFNTYVKLKADIPLTEDYGIITKKLGLNNDVNGKKLLKKDKPSKTVLKVKDKSMAMFVKFMREYRYINLKPSEMLTIKGEEVYIVAVKSKRPKIADMINELNFPGVKIFNIDSKNFI